MYYSIRPELDVLTIKMEKEFKLRSGHLSDFASFELDPVDKFLYPALVILPVKLLNGCREKMFAMAGVVQFIHLAQIIHNRIPDECPKHVPQFPVLIGDYLFSKFFKALSDADLLEWLAPLSSIICEMNEGGVIRKIVLEKGARTEQEYLSVLEQEHGLLAAQACKIGGVISNASQELIDDLEQFGLNIGMAWGIVKEKIPLSPIEFIEKARELTMKFPEGEEVDAMLDLLERIQLLASKNSNCQSFEKSVAAY